MAGLDSGLSYETESNGGAVSFESTGILLEESRLKNVAPCYSFTVTPIEGTEYYSFQNAEKGSYLLVKNSTLYAGEFNSSNSRWGVSIGSDGVATIQNPYSSYSNCITFAGSSFWGNIFQVMSSVSDIYLWRETAAGADYYATLIPQQEPQPCGDGVPCPGVEFSDMPAKNHWAHDAIDWALNQGITNGTGSSSFSPWAPCTRAQVVTFLWRAAGSPAPAETHCEFTDLKQNAYYYQAVLWAVEKGITKGTGDKRFSPDTVCSRSQVVTFLWRAAGCPEAESQDQPFGDVPAEAYYRQAVAWALEREITKGSSASSFSPNAACSRAQVVTFLYRDAIH